MPYKASGKWVMVKKGGRWVKYRRAASADVARRQARALNANVKHK